MALKTLLVLLVLCCPVLCFGSFGQPSPPAVDAQVAALIEEMLNSATEQQAFSNLEALGCPAVSAIIERMDDRRPLPDPHLSLRNKSPEAFEGLRHYRPQQIIDALAAILNQVTGRHFGFIYNGATDAERTRTIHAWHESLHQTSPAKLCDGM
jgi:hypothetical protein